MLGAARGDAEGWARPDSAGLAGRDGQQQTRASPKPEGGVADTKHAGRTPTAPRAWLSETAFSWAPSIVGPLSTGLQPLEGFQPVSEPAQDQLSAGLRAILKRRSPKPTARRKRSSKAPFRGHQTRPGSRRAIRTIPFVPPAMRGGTPKPPRFFRLEAPRIARMEGAARIPTGRPTPPCGHEDGNRLDSALNCRQRASGFQKPHAAGLGWRQAGKRSETSGADGNG